MEARRQGLTVESEGRNLSVSNGLVLVRLLMRDGGYAQEFHALNGKGEYRLVLSSIHKDLTTFSEHRASASPMISGAREHLFAVCRESLRMVFSEATLRRPDESHVVVQLSGSVQGHELVMRIAIEAHSNVIHVSMEDTLPEQNPVLEYSMSSFAFLPGGGIFGATEEPEFTWAPNLRPANDSVIGDAAFFSPAAIVQHGRYAAALIPDLDMLKHNRPMPVSLDLDLCNGLLFAPLLSYGFCDYERTCGSRYFRHDITMSRRLTTNLLSYGCHLIIDADCKRDSARKQVARFMWSRYGVGAAKAKAPISSSRQQILPDAQAAYGLWAEGQRAGREDLIREAKSMRDVVLSSPQNGGLFATRFDREIGFWHGCNSTEGSECYSTAECSAQLYWLLRLNSDFEPDARVLPYARRYADFLIDSRQRSGAIACWYDEDLTPVAALRSGAPTAASALFLAELARATGLKKHSQAFEMMARFVLDRIVPHGLYLDHTTANPTDSISLDCKDPHTGMRLQSSQAVLWVAQLCLELHRLHGGHGHLNTGVGVLDTLCLMQSVGDRPWMPGQAGLLSRGNASSLPDPELSAEFALCALRYGTLTGSAEYCERGAAALRAALSADCDAGSRARIAAVAAIARAEFGAVYVSLAGKWSAELDGYRVERIESRGARAVVELTRVGAGDGEGRVVFGGLRSESYELTINGECREYSREEMESGLAVPE